MALRTNRRALAALALAAAVSGCSVPTEPVIILDCTTLATNFETRSDLITLPSGLRYRDVVVGPGAEVTAGTRVITQYAACLRSGEVFSQVLNPSRFTFTVGTNQVFPGFDEGVQGMRLGGRRELVIPAHLGRDENGVNNAFPVPNDTFVMTVDAVGIR